MSRWIVAFSEYPVEADTAREAVEAFAKDSNRGVEVGHELIVVDLDAIDGTDRMGRFLIGAREIE